MKHTYFLRTLSLLVLAILFVFTGCAKKNGVRRVPVAPPVSEQATESDVVPDISEIAETFKTTETSDGSLDIDCSAFNFDAVARTCGAGYTVMALAPNDVTKGSYTVEANAGKKACSFRGEAPGKFDFFFFGIGRYGSAAEAQARVDDVQTVNLDPKGKYKRTVVEEFQIANGNAKRYNENFVTNLKQYIGDMYIAASGDKAIYLQTSSGYTDEKYANRCVTTAGSKELLSAIVRQIQR